MTNFDFGKVAVLMGGNSPEREISLQSGQAVYAGLCAASVDAHMFDTRTQGIEDLIAGRFDRAWIALHGRSGEDGSIQGVLEVLQMPYTGSGVLACALAMDKVKSKKLWQQEGLPTANYHVAAHADGTDITLASFEYPVFVKPTLEGSSIGVTKVLDQSGLAEALDQAWSSGCDALIEEYLPGEEVTVAILGGKVLPVIRLEAANEFYDYEAKYLVDSTNYHCPSGLTESLEHDLQNIAKQAFETLGCRGWGRVDLMLDRHGHPNLLEANLVPGMTKHSLVPMAAKAAGIDFDTLVLQILETSL